MNTNEEATQEVNQESEQPMKFVPKQSIHLQTSALAAKHLSYIYKSYAKQHRNNELFISMFSVCVAVGMLVGALISLIVWLNK